ncbi:unnamed protein product [Callosobruchus maculatus]|uniref:C2H2-type domain-containing protein n=1 Tax=Callosobruchus maculatus TaxID=64391 RepID=A0A653D6A9_CALMS|nr:unnamed protein product [Callosobruchus maculatus]
MSACPLTLCMCGPITRAASATSAGSASPDRGCCRDISGPIQAFADKSNLRAHVQTHSNTKPHVCGRCGKAFALKSYLYKHEESSCMRMNPRRPSREATPDKSVASPTPVIVSLGSALD